jgi:hypothetical protein
MSLQSNYLAKLNKIQSLQQQVAYWEHPANDYKKACAIFQEYIDCLRGFQDPKTLINSYIRYAAYCEIMEDRLLSTALLKEAVCLMQYYQIGNNVNLERMRQKIDDLSFYY